MADDTAMNRRLPLCGARTRSGGTCRKAAGFGTDHVGYGRCKFHAGSTPGGRAGAQRQRLAAVVPSPIGGFEAIERGLATLNGIQDALTAEVEKLQEGVLDGDELKAVVRLLRDASRDLASVGKLAADVGLDERKVRLEEAKVSLVAATLRAVFADPELDLDAARQELAARVTARHLRELEAGS